MCLVCVLSTTVFEIAMFIVKIQQHAQLMERLDDLRKNSSVRQAGHHKYGETFNISRSVIFFNNDSCFQTNLQHNYSEKNNEHHYATSPEMGMTSVIRLHSNVTSIAP